MVCHGLLVVVNWSCTLGGWSAVTGYYQEPSKCSKILPWNPNTWTIIGDIPNVSREFWSELKQTAGLIPGLAQGIDIQFLAFVGCHFPLWGCSILTEFASGIQQVMAIHHLPGF